jgi:hypothetical protein
VALKGIKVIHEQFCLAGIISSVDVFNASVPRGSFHNLC